MCIRDSSNGDGFKNYPSDYSNRAFWCESKLGNLPRQLIYRITKFDISKIERGLRFYFLLNKLKGFDYVPVSYTHLDVYKRQF